jgi:hypothetical protein
VPKGGATGQRYPTDDGWKEAVRLRLKELDWSDSEFARKLSVTTGAVNYLLTKAVSSTLRPKVEKLLGWPESRPPGPPTRLAVGSRRSAPSAPPAASQGREKTNTEQLAELIDHFQALNHENRVRLIERASALRDGESSARDDSHD